MIKTQIELFVIQRIREIRIRQGISQSMLAYGIGVSAGFIGQVESPKYPAKYNLNHLNEIAQYLNCHLTDFFPKEPILT